jgi:hypothetical protein
MTKARQGDEACAHVLPTLPNEGTDCDRLLLALQMAHPEVVWNPNSSLSLMAHSRAADLRKLGWDVEAVRVRDLESPKGAKWGYRLVTPTTLWPSPPAERHMRVIRKGRVVA